MPEKDNRFRVTIAHIPGSHGIVHVSFMDHAGKETKWTFPLSRPELLEGILSAMYHRGFDDGEQCMQERWISCQ